MTLSAIDRIEADTDWLPHRLDLRGRSIEFVRTPREIFTAPGFLFEYTPADASERLSVPLSRIDDISVDSVPLHFIFHTAFCRSTLLSRALNIDGISIGLSEPGIIADLASAGPLARGLQAPILRLLSRRRDGAKAVFIKPTNHANRIIPELLDAAPDARAVLMTNPLAPFLLSVRKRGLMGHRWGRKLFLELQGYAGMDFGMPPEETFAMTDLQAAGAAWLLNQKYFSSLASGSRADRVRVLDGDYFNKDRGETVKAVLDFCSVGGETISAAELASSSVFAVHAKLGGEVVEAPIDPATEAEVSQVSQWLEMIANQLGLAVPIKQTLL